MIAESIYLLLQNLDERRKRRLLRLVRRQLRFISRHRVLSELVR
jgi:hypothetical protein